MIPIQPELCSTDTLKLFRVRRNLHLSCVLSINRLLNSCYKIRTVLDFVFRLLFPKSSVTSFQWFCYVDSVGKIYGTLED